PRRIARPPRDRAGEPPRGHTNHRVEPPPPMLSSPHLAPRTPAAGTTMDRVLTALASPAAGGPPRPAKHLPGAHGLSTTGDREPGLVGRRTRRGLPPNCACSACELARVRRQVAHPPPVVYKCLIVEHYHFR